MLISSINLRVSKIQGNKTKSLISPKYNSNNNLNNYNNLSRFLKSHRKCKCNNLNSNNKLFLKSKDLHPLSNNVLKVVSNRKKMSEPLNLIQLNHYMNVLKDVEDHLMK